MERPYMCKKPMLRNRGNFAQKAKFYDIFTLIVYKGIYKIKKYEGFAFTVLSASAAGSDVELACPRFWTAFDKHCYKANLLAFCISIKTPF